MRVRILGSAAGGGFPQWNCNCGNCRGVRDGTIRTRARTQSSIAASGDGQRWVLFNASPDILQQIREFPALQPGDRLRTTAIAAIVLIDAQIDHTTGLLMLREHDQPLELWCTEPVFQDLTTGNPVLKVLGHFAGVRRHRKTKRMRQMGDLYVLGNAAEPGHVRLHDLRHYVATRLLDAGIPVREVSERLGHASAMTTLTIYAASVPATDRAAADIMGHLLDGQQHRGRRPARKVARRGS